MSIPAESITNCDTNKLFNRANFYLTITYTYIMITMCKNLLFVLIDSIQPIIYALNECSLTRVVFSIVGLSEIEQ